MVYHPIYHNVSSPSQNSRAIYPTHIHLPKTRRNTCFFQSNIALLCCEVRLRLNHRLKASRNLLHLLPREPNETIMRRETLRPRGGKIAHGPRPTLGISGSHHHRLVRDRGGLALLCPDIQEEVADELGRFGRAGSRQRRFEDAQADVLDGDEVRVDFHDPVCGFYRDRPDFEGSIA